MRSEKGHSYLRMHVAAALAAVTLIFHSLAFAAPTHFWLAANHDWAAKRGYFLVVENTVEPGAVAKLNDALVLLAVGDGTDFRYLRSNQKFELQKDYLVRAVITDAAAELWIDGKRVAQAPGKFIPVSHFEANTVPSFMKAPSAYRVQELHVRVASGAKTLLDQRFSDSSDDALALFGSTSVRAELPATAPIAVEVGFRFANGVDLRKVSPVIDRYGQAIAASFPTKVMNDAQLLATVAAEDARLKEWGSPANLDKFGGSTSVGWNEKPTGFFRVLERDDQWWLISPDGNPAFYTGICAAPDLLWPCSPVNEREFLFAELPPRDGAYADCWGQDVWHNGDGQDYVSFHAANMVRKYGTDWKRAATERSMTRARALGFGGYGKWSTGDNVVTLPVLFHGGVPNLVRHPDIFDPNIQSLFREDLRKQIEPRRSDPYLLGWSVGNEMDECIAPDDITKILAMSDEVPAKKALREFYTANFHRDLSSESKPSDAELEQLRGFYADRYYSFIYHTVKEIDPNHLYFGFWPVPGYWVNENDWRWVAPHCDVIGFDCYSRDFESEPTGRLIKEFRKPVLNGEFSHAPNYDGKRGFGSYHNATSTDTDAGKQYAKWVRDAATNPYCVGLFYFAYRDQNLTGRGPGKGADLVHGENYAFGLVDVTDTLKWDFVELVRSANLSAIKWRLEARKK